MNDNHYNNSSRNDEFLEQVEARSRCKCFVLVLAVADPAQLVVVFWSIRKQFLPRRIRLTARQGGSANGSKDVQKKKEEPPPELTPLEKMLQNAGPVRSDGSDKYFGLENVSCLHNQLRP